MSKQQRYPRRITPIRGNLCQGVRKYLTMGDYHRCRYLAKRVVQLVGINRILSRSVSWTYEETP